MEYFAINLSKLKTIKKTSINIKNRPILIAYTENGVFAIKDKCPHMGSPLSTGTLDKEIIICKHHGLPISVETGKVTNIDKANFLKLDEYSLDVKTYKTIIKNDEVYIEI